MTKYPIYRYLGTNGIVESSVYLEGAYSVKMYKLVASFGCALKNGDRIEEIVVIPESEIENWIEIPLTENTDKNV